MPISVERVYEMNRLACSYYEASLSADDEKAEKARCYIAKRGWKESTIRTFRLGYAPDKWTALYYHLKEKGFQDEEQVEAGLVTQSKKNGKYYDRFRNRVIFPIEVAGNIAGFGARALDELDKPKYLNTSESPVFSKCQLLYGLDIAGLSMKDSRIVVEGYTDVISLYDAGVMNSVATLGTALSSYHATLFEQHADILYLCFDGDEAGITAANRAISILSETNLKARVLTLPGGKDPDDLLREESGKETFLVAMGKAPEALAYQLGQIKSETGFENAAEKTKFAMKAASYLRRNLGHPEIDHYIRVIATRLNIPEDIFRDKVYGQLMLAKSRLNEV